eukprot:43087-Eustigmatos_ZCMA.PRE.1
MDVVVASLVTAQQNCKCDAVEAVLCSRVKEVRMWHHSYGITAAPPTSGHPQTSSALDQNVSRWKPTESFETGQS